MNPLCCIAPVSLDRGDRDPSPMVGLKSSKPSIGAESPTRNSSSKKLIQVPVILSDSDAAACVETEAEEAEGLESGDGRGGSGNGAVAGVIWKWVNYGKGWRSRWFVLQDGVLSYYKVHGPDRISVGSAGRESGVRVIGEESLRRMRKEQQLGMGSGGYAGPRWKPFGEVHLKVSSVRASKSDDKRLYIFTGTKTLHLRCDSREDRTAWLDALLSAKDHFARSLAINEPEPSVEVTVSTDKLRVKLMQEGLSEAAVKECETIMLSEVSELQDQLKSLQQRHLILLDTLRQLETEKVELETTIIDERKEREAQLGMVNGRFSDFYSIISEGTATDSEVDNESQGADVDTDEDDGTYFDTRDFLSAELLRNTSYRSREAMGNGCVVSACSIESTFPANCQDMVLGVRRIEYPYVERRNKLPEPKEKEKPVGLWSIIKENIGKDLSGVCLPVYFNEPLSSLQKCFEDLEYSYLVDRALEWGRQGNSLMRILHIAAFAVSGYASTEGRQCKPFNPLLGETYEADYPDKGLRFISEKVSHHPMVVACHCDGRGWTFCGDSNLKGKFWGRSIQLDPIGILTLQFEDGETFQWSKVTTSIYNIIIGKIYCDHYGTMRIRGSGQYSCKLKFKEQSIIDRNPHQARKLQEKGWQPRWFRRNREDDCYQYVGGYWEARKQRKWDEIPDVFGKGDDLLSIESIWCPVGLVGKHQQEACARLISLEAVDSQTRVAACCLLPAACCLLHSLVVSGSILVIKSQLSYLDSNPRKWRQLYPRSLPKEGLFLHHQQITAGAIRMHDQQIVTEGTKGKRLWWWDQDYARVRDRRPINNRFSP
ncbi:oxysterol-binding protein-related protein 1D-like isoform X2 [Zingiber officinale]|uniref:oxysterol-binding protein-related protein 1D-like isoform X2 n=1 Tax=Zingiber officinale TaxID=94328 RepID=UPI001C4BAC9E|nr:oxysterol-binding protein-related protein 1D-like isoform X2 [Zingiber officinale]